MSIERFRQVCDRLRGDGFTVTELPGWRTRGRGGFAPRGMVMHHTGQPRPMTTASRAMLHILANGHGALSGNALCNFATDQAGTAYLVAAGTAWHAGEGGWMGLRGNSTVIGNEAVHTGARSEPWTEAHYRVQVALARHCAEAFGFPFYAICDHKEWAPRRKVDRVAITPQAFRHDVRDYTPGANDMCLPLTKDPKVKSEDVRRMQVMLRQLGQEIVADGFYGDQTEAAIKALFPAWDATKVDGFGMVQIETAYAEKVISDTAQYTGDGAVDVKAVAREVARLLKVTT